MLFKCDLRDLAIVVFDGEYQCINVKTKLFRNHTLSVMNYVRLCGVCTVSHRQFILDNSGILYWIVQGTDLVLYCVAEKGYTMLLSEM